MEDDPAQTDEPAAAASVQPRFDARLFGRRLSTAFLLGALAIVVYPVATIAWASWAARGEVEAYDAYAKKIEGELQRPGLYGDGSYEFWHVAQQYRKVLKPGDRLGRITIPKIDLNTVVYEGSDDLELDGYDSTLTKGPGRMSWTALPGEGANTAIAGHRTTYTHPFWSLDELKKGDKIVVTMPYGIFRYKVTGTDTVMPYRVDVTEDRHFDELTLSTCTPRYSATKRLIVHARQYSATPARKPTARPEKKVSA